MALRTEIVGETILVAGSAPARHVGLLPVQLDVGPGQADRQNRLTCWPALVKLDRPVELDQSKIRNGQPGSDPVFVFDDFLDAVFVSFASSVFVEDLRNGFVVDSNVNLEAHTQKKILYYFRNDK